MVFVVDSSLSIWAAGGGSALYWDMQLEFISRIIDAIPVGPDQIRIGIVVFGDTVRTELELSQTTNSKDVINTVKNLNFLGGTTFTSNAIATATEMFQRNRREGVRRIMFLITDGVPNSRANTISQANIAKLQNDIIIATVGVNLDMNNIDQPDSAVSVLLDVSTRQELFYLIDSFDNLLAQTSNVQRNVFCRSVCKYNARPVITI